MSLFLEMREWIKDRRGGGGEWEAEGTSREISIQSFEDVTSPSVQMSEIFYA